MSGVNSKDFSTLTVTDTAAVVSTAASPAMVAGTKGAVIHVENAPIRYREDGTAPTATEGAYVEAGGSIVYNSWTIPGADWRSVLRALQVIRVTDTSALLKIHWYD